MQTALIPEGIQTIRLKGPAGPLSFSPARPNFPTQPQLMLGPFLPALAVVASKLFDESGSELDGLFAFGAILTMKATRTLAEYLKHAEECRQLAASMAAPEDKRVFRELAQTWERLARIRQKDITPDDIEIPPESKL